jgi:glutamate synthase domain-containing protein 3
MTGGQVYVYGAADDLELALNDDLVAAHEPDPSQLEEVRALLERHVRYTESARAAAILERWEDEAPRFTRIASRTEIEAAEADREEAAAVAAP